MATPKTLFDLPGEIRNIIYEYALTSPRKQLQYRTPNTSNHLTKPIFTPFLKPSQPLTLGKDVFTPANEFNQLQYVNRQLRTETGGLELQFNTLSFFGDKLVDDASIQLVNFLDSLSPIKASWALKIVVKDGTNQKRGIRLIDGQSPHPSYPFTDHPEYIFDVAQRCRDNPQLKVTWCLSQLRVTGSKVPPNTEAVHPTAFISQVLQVMYITRPDASSQLSHLYKTTRPERWQLRYAERHWDAWTVDDFYAENLVFKPVMEFKKKRWEKWVHGRTIGTHFYSDRLYAQLEEWWKNGI